MKESIYLVLCNSHKYVDQSDPAVHRHFKVRAASAEQAEIRTSEQREEFQAKDAGAWDTGRRYMGMIHWGMAKLLNQKEGEAK